MKARLTYLFSVISLVFATAVTPSIAASRRDPGWPPVYTTSSSPVAGQSVTITITFGGSNSTDETVDLSSSANVFTNLPSQVVQHAGQTSVQFTATVASNATGSYYVTASNSVGSAMSATYEIYATGGGR
jgi:hypothetical protein